jgi:hypothetical protein
MPRIIGGSISQTEYENHVKKILGKGFEAHESHYIMHKNKTKKIKEKKK